MKIKNMQKLTTGSIISRNKNKPDRSQIWVFSTIEENGQLLNIIFPSQETKYGIS